MANEKEKLEQNQREKPMSFIANIIIIGLFAGIFWSGLAYFAYIIGLTEIKPTVILEPWTIGDWKKGWLGILFSLILIGVVSVVAALVYYVALKKFNRIWIGMAYGVVLFVIVFFILNPIFPGIKPFFELKRDTIVTSLCFYILYGTFVGYSISYEANEMRNRENNPSEVTS